MSGYRNGYIELDSPREVFYPGQVVLGNVVYEIEEPLSLVVLFVDFIGIAKVDWKEEESEERNGVMRYKDVEYVGREEYFNTRQLLAGGNAPVSQSPGSYTYQFSFQIPPGVPSSFSGERGIISYKVEATIELRGQDVLTEKLTKFFEVIAPFDLNFGSPKVKEPIELEFEEVVGCSCFSSSPINVRVRLPVSGYCPGQIMPVELNVENRANVEVRKFIFEILTRERYRTQRPVSEYVSPERVLATIKKGAVMSGSKRNITVEVKLPDLIAPFLENCGIIDVGYFLKVKIQLSGCNDDMEDEAEFCLGLVPLHETVQDEYIHPYSENLPVGPIPDIPAINQQEQNRQDANQHSAYPGQQSGYPGQFPNTGPPPGYPNGPAGYPTGPNSGYPYPNTTVQSSYVIQVQELQYSSTDPSKNYNIGFTLTSPTGVPHFPSNKDLRIHLPQSVDVTTPSAPPPSS